MLKNEILNVLMHTDPFEMLDTEVLSNLAETMESRHYPPDAYVFKQGTPSQDCLFIIASGLVEITSANDRGIETVVGIRRPYDFFSETVVLSQQRYPASARVREALICCLVKKQDLERLIYTYPEFSGFFNTLLAERMRILYSEIVSEQSCEAYGRNDSPMFSKHVSEVMSYPVITCRAGTLSPMPPKPWKKKISAPLWCWTGRENRAAFCLKKTSSSISSHPVNTPSTLAGSKIC